MATLTEHVGEFSMALFEDDCRKLLWAEDLFEPRTPQLTDQVEQRPGDFE